MRPSTENNLTDLRSGRIARGQAWLPRRIGAEAHDGYGDVDKPPTARAVGGFPHS
jgi:hypothetical protein